MRTTLTLEDHLVHELKLAASKRQISFKEAVNRALRHGLEALKAPRKAAPFRVKPFRLGLKPGIDPDKLGQLLDEMEVRSFVGRMRRKKR
jgi:hypothetical protein